MSKSIKWTDQMLLTALQMRSGGHSAAAIGRHLGMTRSSVCGVLKRIDDESAIAEGGAHAQQAH